MLILLDGLDEAAFTDIKQGANLYSSHAILEAFITQLLHGNILPNSKKLITLRPQQLYELSKEIRPSFVVSLTGIDRKAQQQLCKYICGQESDHMFATISEQPYLLTYCFVPVLCSLVMHCMKCSHQTDETDNPKTISNVFVSVLYLLLRDTPHCIANSKKPKIDFPSYLNNFSMLAWKHFEKRKYFFDSNELDKFGLGGNEKHGFLDVTLD